MPSDKMYTHFSDQNPIVATTLKVWWDLVIKYKIEGDCKMLIWPSHSPEFRTGQLDNTFTKWRDSEITAVCTVTDGKVFKSFKKKSLS